MIRINRVYQKVLMLANKEQRGYITPQEFNLFADMAQMEIFEQYFYDINQTQRGVGNQTDYADILEYDHEKLLSFMVNDQELIPNSLGRVVLPSSDIIYMLGTVRVDYRGSYPYLKTMSLASEIKQRDRLFLINDASENNGMKSITHASHQFPVYSSHSDINGSFIHISPLPSPDVDTVQINYIRKPSTPNWTYITVANQGTALYNPTATDHQDFELHSSEENKLVVKILQYAGVTLKDNQLLQAAASKEMSKEQQEKQ